jgi:hypothetical protein
VKALASKVAAVLRAAVAGWAPDALMAGGAASVAYGAWLLAPAAGFVVGGLLAMVGGVIVARRA